VRDRLAFDLDRVDRRRIVAIDQVELEAGRACVDD
jgi:hypothetical protein